jgi:rubrerythrin
MVDMTDQSSAGPSVWERDLFEHLTNHAQAESGLLEHYSAVADQTESKAFRYLVNLLLEEEMRHHRIFVELADSLKTEAELGEDPIVPYVDFNRADPAGVLDGTKQLLEKEKQDALELKRLQRELRDVRDNSLWSLLVDLMQRDTQKHIAILRFVQKHTRNSR